VRRAQRACRLDANSGTIPLTALVDLAATEALRTLAAGAAQADAATDLIIDRAGEAAQRNAIVTRYARSLKGLGQEPEALGSRSSVKTAVPHRRPQVFTRKDERCREMQRVRTAQVVDERELDRPLD
jgi:hypothetical protein